MITRSIHDDNEVVNSELHTLTPYEEARAFFRCIHEKTQIRYKVYSNGTQHYFEQCLNCGCQVGTAIPHKNIPSDNVIVRWDEGLEAGHQFQIDEMANQIRAERDELWRNRQTEWDQKYAVYIQSDQWKDKRQRVLKRDNNLCQGCLRRTAQEVHHLTYRYPLGKEPLFALVSVCQYCHDALHELTVTSREVNRG